MAVTTEAGGRGAVGAGGTAGDSGVVLVYTRDCEEPGELVTVLGGLAFVRWPDDEPGTAHGYDLAGVYATKADGTPVRDVAVHALERDVLAAHDGLRRAMDLRFEPVSGR